MAKVENNQENFDRCECFGCPSFPKVDGEGLFCARGKSSAKIARDGCECPECPIWTECGLARMYYCQTGAA